MIGAIPAIMAATSVKPYLQLIRLPNVFTAGADSLAGFLFVGGSLTGSFRWIWLVLGSMAIYAGGIALNDVFDVEIDRVERPQRPIPSGRVPYRVALWLAISLLALGWISASLTSDPRSMVVATLLIAAVVAYDMVLRLTKLGPQAMGLCRALNLVLGMTCGPAFSTVPYIEFYVAAYWAFVTGVTWISRNEASGGGKSLLWVGTALQGSAFAGFGFPVTRTPAVLESPNVWRTAGIAVLAILAFRIFQKNWSAIRAPGPQTIQTAVKTAILSLVWLHFGLLLGIRGWLAGLIVGLFWVPAVSLGRWIYST